MVRTGAQVPTTHGPRGPEGLSDYPRDSPRYKGETSRPCPTPDPPPRNEYDPTKVVYTRLSIVFSSCPQTSGGQGLSPWKETSDWNPEEMSYSLLIPWMQEF